MKKFLRKKNRVLKAIDDNNLGSLPRILLSSFVVIFIFYSRLVSKARRRIADFSS